MEIIKHDNVDIPRRGAVRSACVNAIVDMITNNDPCVEFKFDDKKPLNSTYNTLYVFFKYRRDIDISMFRRGFSLFVVNNNYEG